MIPVFFSIDDNYAPYLAVALRSAIDNADPTRTFRAIVLHRELSADNRARLAALATERFAVEFMPMQNGLDAIGDCMGNRLRCDYFTLTIYFRLFIATMFPQYDKAVYIDSDVVVTGDLGQLFDIELGDCLIGACADRSVADVPPLVHYMENGVGVPRDRYINSGVLLMNLRAMRQEGFEAHFLHLLTTYGVDTIAPDQDYLNAMCAGRILYLDEAWDAMPHDTRPPLAQPYIIHYNLFSKPWCYDGIQYGDIFWHYAAQSGYLPEITAYKAAYSDEQRQSDAACLRLLCERGAAIPDNAVTFKKLAAQGVRVAL